MIDIQIPKKMYEKLLNAASFVINFSCTEWRDFLQLAILDASDIWDKLRLWQNPSRFLIQSSIQLFKCAENHSKNM